MALASIADIRRRELIQAAFEVIKRDGLQFTTTAKIEEAAGASRGTIHKYFRNKQELAESSIRHALSLRQREFVARLRQSRSPSERLWAVCAANLHPRYLSPGFSRAWVTILAEATENKLYARIVRALYERERSNIVHGLQMLGHEHDIPGVALALQLFFDGSRYRSGFVTRKHDPRQEAAFLLHYLKHNVPRFDLSAAKQEIATWHESP